MPQAAKGGAGADLANLRLGIALARSGDKAGATAALNAVKGTRAGIAQLWLAYLQRDCLMVGRPGFGRGGLCSG